MPLLDLRPTQSAQRNAGSRHRLSLLAHGLALAGREVAEEIIEAGIAAVSPVELVAEADHEIALLQNRDFVFGGESYVQ